MSRCLGALPICKNQTYALSAKAKGFVFNSLAYCECDILAGNRVTATYSYPVIPMDAAKQNICDLNAKGARTKKLWQSSVPARSGILLHISRDML